MCRREGEEEQLKTEEEEKEEEEVVEEEDFIWNPKGLRRMLTRWNQSGWPLRHDSTVLLWHPPYGTPPP